MRAINFYNDFGVRSGPEIAGQRGFTLVEIMVALTLGLVVTIGVIQVFLGTQKSAQIQQAASRMQEDGRIAIDLLNRYIRLAGYTTHPWSKIDPDYNNSWNPASYQRGFPANGPFALNQVVSGGDNNVFGVDSIRIRYQGSGGNQNENPPVTPGDGSITTCLGRAVPINQIADITFSLTANNPAQGGRSLQCTDNNTGNAQPLLAGLQDMQIWYGLSTTDDPNDPSRRLTGATAYVPANQVPANRWNQVISVRISLLMRSEQDRLTLEPQTIQFNDATLPVNDHRMRYVMGTTINVRNQGR